MSAHVDDLLAAYLDGELTVTDAASVRQHLSTCAPCTSRLDVLRSVDRAFQEMPTEAPAGYFDGFSARVRERIAASSKRPRFRLPVWSLAAAACLLLAAVLPRLPWDRPAAPGPVSQAPNPATAPAAAAPLVSDDGAATARAPAAESIPSPAFGRDLALKAADPKRKGEESDEALLKKDALGFDARARDEDAFSQRLAPGAPPAERPSIAGGARERKPQAAKEEEKRESAASGATASPDALADAPQRSAREEATEQALTIEPQAAAPAMSAGREPSAAPRPAPPGAGVEPFGEAQDRRQKLAAPGARADQAEAEYEALARRETSDRGRDTAEMRSLRTRWRAFAARHPQGPRSDEARVRAVALGVEIARASAESRDVEEARRDALAYLDRDDAVQKDRVRALLAGLP